MTKFEAAQLSEGFKLGWSGYEVKYQLRVHCDTTTEDKNTISHWKITRYRMVVSVTFDDKIRRDPMKYCVSTCAMLTVGRWGPKNLLLSSPVNVQGPV